MTELILTLEAAVDALDSDLRPIGRDMFKSTPNLKDMVVTRRNMANLKVPSPLPHPPPMNLPLQGIQSARQQQQNLGSKRQQHEANAVTSPSGHG